MSDTVRPSSEIDLPIFSAGIGAATSGPRPTSRLMPAQGTPISAPRVAAGRLPLFCDTALAGRIERAEAQLIAKASEAARRRGATEGFVIPVAGGVASFAEEGSPYNKVAGLGFDGVPGTAALGEVEHAFTARGAPERVTPPGVEVRPSGEEEFEAWFDVVQEGFAHPDAQGVPSHEEFPREVVARAERDFAAVGVMRYIALRDGVAAGGARLHLAGGIARLTGAATAPAHRRHGVQTALLSARLAAAAAAGCDIAVVTTRPGSKSQQNVQRQGFDLLYTRAVLVKQP